MQDIIPSTIVFLGAGIMQFPAVYIAKELGYSTLAFDKNASAYCAEHLDSFVAIDIKDTQSITEYLRSYTHNASAICGIYSIGTDFQYQVSVISQALSLPSLTVVQSENATNKSRMKFFFEKSGITTAPFVVLDELEQPEPSRFARLTFPLVVKPIDNMGSRGVKIVKNRNSIENAVQNARDHSPSRSVVCESFIEGEELSIDLLLKEGKVSYQSVADRIIGFAPHRVELGHTLPSRLSASQELNKAVGLLTRAAQSLDIAEGAIKGDLLLSGKKIFVGELAARPSGGYMSGWTSVYGQGQGPLVLLLSKGKRHNLDSELPPQTHSKIAESEYCAERAIMSLPGVLESVGFIPYWSMPPWCKHVFWAVEKGEKIDLPTNNVTKAGNIIVTAPDAVNLAHRIPTILSAIEIRVSRNIQADSLFTDDWDSGDYAPWYNHNAPQLIALEKEYNHQNSKNASYKNSRSPSPSPSPSRSHITNPEGALPINATLFFSLWDAYAPRTQNNAVSRTQTPDFCKANYCVQSTEQLGTWTHATLKDTVGIALKRNLLYNSNESWGGQDIVLRSLLRAGFSGLRYLIHHGLVYDI